MPHEPPCFPCPSHDVFGLWRRDFGVVLVNGGGPGSGAVGGSAGANASARGAASLTIQNSGLAATDYSCGTAHLLTWGQLDASGFATPELAVIDGQNGASVKCTWSGDLTYELSGTLLTASTSLRLVGSVASATGIGTAQISLFDLDQQVPMSDSNCTLQINAFSVTNGSYSSTVSCDHLVSADDTHLWCALSGTVAFGGCVK